MSTVFRRAYIKPGWCFLLVVTSVAFLICLGGGELTAGEFKKTSCWFEIPRDRAMTCGTVNVPENRKKTGGTEVVLSVVVFEPDRERHEPVVFLTGGPGAAYRHCQ